MQLKDKEMPEGREGNPGGRVLLRGPVEAGGCEGPSSKGNGGKARAIGTTEAYMPW